MQQLAKKTVLNIPINMDVVPCVSEEVEILTPEEKYKDLQEKSDYRLNNESIKNELSMLDQILRLNNNANFQRIKKQIGLKNLFTTTNEYEHTCQELAKTIGLQLDNLSLEQRYQKDLENVIKTQTVFTPAVFPQTQSKKP